jgi:chromosome segregation ATPase
MKEEFNKDMESDRKKNQTEILETKNSLNQINNTVETHSSRLEQVKDRISEPEHKIDIKEKNKRILRQKIQGL